MKIEETRTEECQLLGDFFAGDDAAFNELFRRYNKKLSVFALKMLGNREHAVDLAQDTWSRVIDQRRKPQHVEYVGGYLFRIARNLCLDRLRARKEHPSIDEIPENQHPKSHPVEQTDIEEIVVRALDELPDEDRELLILHTYVGYGYDEIAEMQSKKPEAVWTRASRARSKLRDIVRRNALAQGVNIPSDQGDKN